MASSGVMSSAPRPPASSAASSIASRGWTAVAPAAIAIASPWTSRMSAGVDEDIGATSETGGTERRVHRPDGQDGRHRRSVERHRSVADREELDRPGLDREQRLRREPVEGLGQPVGSVGGRPRSRRADAPGAVRSDRQGRRVGDDRSIESNGPRRGRDPAEQRRPPTDLDVEVHDRPLALRVDRRVRDLGERLAQVVRDGSVDPCPAGRRRVVAHAPERLLRLEDHRPDVESSALRVESSEVAERRRGQSVGIVDADATRANGGRSIGDRRPRGVGSPRPTKDLGLRLDVLEDRAPTRIDEQQLTRAQTPEADRLGRRRSGRRPPRTRRPRAGRG